MNKKQFALIIFSFILIFISACTGFGYYNLLLIISYDFNFSIFMGMCTSAFMMYVLIFFIFGGLKNLIKKKK